MLIEFSIYLLAAILGCVIYYKWAQKKQIVDTPNERSSHTHQPIRGMGVVFPILFALSSIHVWLTGGEYLYEGSPLFPTYQALGVLWIGSGVLLIGLTGYLDDRIDLRSYVRLPLYTLSTLIALVPIIVTWDNGFIPILVIVVLIIGIINTYNFMDGINGITGFYSIVLLGTVYYLFELTHISVYIGGFSSIIVFAITFLLVFGFFNFRSKALAFLGDAGSVSLGLSACILLVWAGGSASANGRDCAFACIRCGQCWNYNFKNFSQRKHLQSPQKSLVPRPRSYQRFKPFKSGTPVRPCAADNKHTVYRVFRV